MLSIVLAMMVGVGDSADDVEPVLEWAGPIEGPMSSVELIGYGMTYGLLGTAALAAPSALPRGGHIQGVVDGIGAMAFSSAAFSDNQPLTGVWALASGGALAFANVEMQRRDLSPGTRYLANLAGTFVYFVLAALVSDAEDSLWPSHRIEAERQRYCRPGHLALPHELHPEVRRSHCAARERDSGEARSTAPQP